jgi:hypothetical protein
VDTSTRVARVTSALALGDPETYVVSTIVSTGTGVVFMATVKETAIRQEFQTQQGADLLMLHRALCETERAVLSVSDEGQVGRLAILKKRIAELFKRCGTKRFTRATRA